MFFPVALLVVGAVASAEEDVTARAQAAEEACKGPGAVPHPWDAHLLVVCGGESRLVAVVRCPSGTVACARTATCQPITSSQPEEHNQQQEDVEGSVKRHIPFDEEFPSEDEDSFRAIHPLVRRQVTPPAGGSAASADPGCESGPGLRCADCDQLLVCSADPNGYVRRVANVSCAGGGDGLVCDKSKHACDQLAQGSSCDQVAANGYLCLQPGAFPDPQDCQRYHICNEQLQHFSDTCDLGFDADNGACITEGEACNPTTPLTPVCSTNAAPAVISGRKSFYRVCLPQSPKGYRSAVLKCPSQQTFDAKTGICAYVCDNKKARYPDPLNCRGFYDCPGETGSPTVPKKGTCSTGLAFDAKKRMCIQEANVTTCASTATPTSITTSPTRSPADVPGQCSREGVFPDPYECRRYIVCSRSRVTGNLVRNVRYCPIFTTYNANAGGCWFGFCV